MNIYHVEIMPDTKVIAVRDDGVVVEQARAEEVPPADTVILAVSAQPCRELYENLKESGLEVHLIGDAKEPRKIVEAIDEGFHATMSI